MPDDVGRVAKDAEEGELEDLVVVEGEGRLWTGVSYRLQVKNCAASLTLSWYDDMACASTLEVILSTAPCSVCDIIDMFSAWLCV